jgi:hypothetical protein
MLRYWLIAASIAILGGSVACGPPQDPDVPEEPDVTPPPSAADLKAPR